MCSVIAVKTGPRSYPKYETAVRIHIKLPCKCSVCKLLQFTRHTNVGSPVSRQFRILRTNSVVMILVCQGEGVSHDRLERNSFGNSSN